LIRESWGHKRQGPEGFQGLLFSTPSLLNTQLLEFIQHHWGSVPKGRRMPSSQESARLKSSGWLAGTPGQGISCFAAHVST